MIYAELKHFDPIEVLSPDGLRMMRRGIIPQLPEALHKLDMFRGWLNAPLICNHQTTQLRGFRSPEENHRIYGDYRYTFHYWCAFDIHSPDISKEELFRAAIRFSWRGVYYDEKLNFVHVDLRGNQWYAIRKNGVYNRVDPYEIMKEK